MMILADTSALLTPEEGKELGLTVVPACVILNDQVYRDYEDISSGQLLERMAAGAVPTTSQPSVGELVEWYESTGEEILVLTIGDGLSGGYQNAVMARNMVADPERIHVVDSKTLAGPERRLVEMALRAKKEGRSLSQIREELETAAETSVSFVIPVDFEFLKRSGRLTPIAAKLGNLIKIVPVLTQTEDKKRIQLYSVKRSKKKAVAAIVERLRELGVGTSYAISVCHAGAAQEAEETAVHLRREFAGAQVEVWELSPALVTHGGPGALLIQAIRK